MCAIEGAPYLIRCAVSGTKLRRNWYESAPYLVQSARAHTPHTPHAIGALLARAANGAADRTAR